MVWDPTTPSRRGDEDPERLGLPEGSQRAERYQKAKALGEGLHGIFDRLKKALETILRREKGQGWSSTRREV